jgi:uncharacterized membrane protein
MSHYGLGSGLFVFAILRAVIELGLLVLIIVLCVWAVRRFTGGRRALLNHLDPAERLLRRRYAAGEIGRDEFLARMADLRGESGPPPQPPTSS